MFSISAYSLYISLSFSEQSFSVCLAQGWAKDLRGVYIGITSSFPAAVLVFTQSFEMGNVLVTVLPLKFNLKTTDTSCATIKYISVQRSCDPLHIWRLFRNLSYLAFK
jgi:hypothetical protein